MPNLSISLAERSYDVIVEQGSLSLSGQLIQKRSLTGKIAIISDSNTAPLYSQQLISSLESAGYSSSLHIFEAGEKSKNLSSVEDIANQMVENGHDRSSFVIALGGGVVGDMAGFIASIYYRGIPFVQIPTTIVSQVDSSVGGKTAVDLAAGKNLIGIFHQPQLVIIDPDCLQSLPAALIREGMAEMVKHAALRDPSMLRRLSAMGVAINEDAGFQISYLPELPQLLADNIAIKAYFVEKDERETLGLRAFLNLGHTIGHGIEASVPFGSIMHGAAVALGLRAALYLSRKHSDMSAADEAAIIDCLHSIQLPLQLPDFVNPELALARCASDKKFKAGAIRFVLLRALGQPELVGSLTKEDLRDAISDLTEPCA